jgi:hypothetical protein
MGLSRLFPEIRLASLCQALVLAALAAGCTFNGPLAGPDAPPKPGDDAMSLPVDAPRPWTHRKQITLQHTQIEAPGEGVLTDFPVLISVTDAEIGATALATGKDIIFTAADGTTVLSSEIESFTPTTGQLVAWVRVPNLSSTVNTTLYIYYGPSSLTPKPPQSVWIANYLAVWHLNQDPDLGHNGDIKDATIADRNGTAAMAFDSSDSAPAQIGRGIRFDGSNESLHFNQANFSNQFTISMWVNFIPPMSGENTAMLIANSDSGLETNGFRLSINTTNLPAPDRRIIFNVGSGTTSSGKVAMTADNKIVPNTPTYLAIAVNRSISKAFFYINGASATIDDSISDTFETNSDFDIGQAQNGIYRFPGTLDEIQVSTTLRSREWLLTSYRNQSLPSSFHVFSTEENF